MGRRPPTFWSATNAPQGGPRACLAQEPSAGSSPLPVQLGASFCCAPQKTNACGGRGAKSRFRFRTRADTNGPAIGMPEPLPSLGQVHVLQVVRHSSFARVFNATVDVARAHAASAHSPGIRTGVAANVQRARPPFCQNPHAPSVPKKVNSSGSSQRSGTNSAVTAEQKIGPKTSTTITPPS